MAEIVLTKIMPETQSAETCEEEDTQKIHKES